VAGPTLNRGSTLTGGVLAAVSQVDCDASRDHKWLVNGILARDLTPPHPLGVKGEVPTPISSMKEQQMPSRIYNPELRYLGGPVDDACQLRVGRAKAELNKRVPHRAAAAGGEPKQADRSFERVVRPADRGRPAGARIQAD